MYHVSTIQSTYLPSYKIITVKQMHFLVPMHEMNRQMKSLILRFGQFIDSNALCSLLSLFLQNDRTIIAAIQIILSHYFRDTQNEYH